MKTRLDFCFLIALIISVVIIIVDSNSAMLSNTRSVLFIAVKPLVHTAQVTKRVQTTLQQISEEREDLRDRNLELVEENQQLRKKVIELQNEELRNRWLAELLEVKEQIEYPVVSSKILSVQLQPTAQKVMLDRGLQEQVYIGQPVVDHRGVIGQITSATLSNSAVTLITDANHSLPVHIQRNGIAALVHGTGSSDRLVVSGLRSNQDVQLGDLLLTSGLGQRFPPGYPVAEVTEVISDENAPFAEVSAAPLATLDSNFEVLVVWTKIPNEVDETPLVSVNSLGEQ